MLSIGKFQWDGKAIYGPAEYMQERGHAKLDEILSGSAVAFNLCADRSPNIETAILVALQTDYAGWVGIRNLLGTEP